ncbi:hypothetical protein BO78DRAFT_469328 [Aspergillus sclerotiicarbonarius CBS 121057]|uniref:Uncharacterized protein n=1 Tax=Aspergillus sclerotiicarbonarius (strain CBS 121057 / IBT 28362) TaxID=1448318 RepID=A0A319EY89_ASPSB|nr:hypothetical protein BO78DRAFT_469328 [Aspergillus sclerotiicarbonarius CBS 121057]
MALPLYIPPCIHTPADKHHLPPPDQPLRIQIEGPLSAIQRLLPDTPWHLDWDFANPTFPQPAGPALAKLAYQQIYGRDVSTDIIPGDLVIRDEYLGWMREKDPDRVIDYYGITFDYLIPKDNPDPNPEVLQINIIEIEDDGGEYANRWLLFQADAEEYRGKKVLAVPRCCQKRKGTQDRWRVNACVHQRRGGYEGLLGAEEFRDLVNGGGEEREGKGREGICCRGWVVARRIMGNNDGRIYPKSVEVYLSRVVGLFLTLRI